MRSQSGITTTTVIIYIIAMMLVIGIIATITSFFYNNIMNIDENSNNLSVMTKFHMYFLEETNKEENQVAKIQTNSISFTSGNTFIFQDQSIYFNHVRICDHISDLQFRMDTKNNKQVIEVLLVIGTKSEYSKIMKYVLNTDVNSGNS